MLMAHRPDAIIWEIARSGEEPVVLLDKNLLDQVPIITMEENLLGVPSVLDVQNRTASRQIVHHLFDEGYEHIGVIGGPAHWQVARKRLAGWQQAVVECGFEPQERQIVHGDWSAASGSLAMAQLMDQYPEIDAVYACNDQMALGALIVLHERGIAVPDQFGVAGFDDLPESEFFWPPLTTVHQPFDQYAAILVRSAVEMIESNLKYGSFEAPETTVICPKVVIRKSSKRGRV
jgi:LacI family transcriptional regulator